MDELIRKDLEKLFTMLQDRLNNRIIFFQNLPGMIRDDSSYKMVKTMLRKEEKEIFLPVHMEDIKDSLNRLNQHKEFASIRVLLNQIPLTINKLKKEILVVLGNTVEGMIPGNLQKASEHSVKELNSVFTKVQGEIRKILRQP